MGELLRGRSAPVKPGAPMDWEDVRAQRHATTQSALEMYGNVTQRKTEAAEANIQQILHVLKVGKTHA